MSWIVIVCLAMLVAAAVVTVIRAEVGPSMLHRMVAVDLLVSVIIAGLALEAAWHRRTDTVPVLVALSLVGFVGSVTVARFAAIEPPGQHRMVTEAEIEAERDTGQSPPEQKDPS